MCGTCNYGIICWNAKFGFIGIVGAIGLAFRLAINDSIVVLAAMKGLDAQKTDYKLQELVETVIRATRHIITTTATTIGGLFSPNCQQCFFFQPLAWAYVCWGDWSICNCIILYSSNVQNFFRNKELILPAVF